jgi:chaperone modulatory protein CbpM
MIGIDLVITQNAGLRKQDLERWILNEWVRPERNSGAFTFGEIDVARVKLLRQLSEEMDINEEALPVVLSLLDQIYDLRRHMLALGEAITDIAPEHFRHDLLAQLAKRAPRP